MMVAAHFSMQTKGGVGKSWVAIAMAQYLKEKGVPLRAVDVEASNTACTLSGFKGIGAELLDVIIDNAVVARRFDDLQNLLLGNPETFVVDVGTSIAQPYFAYLKDNDAFGYLLDAGREVFLHVPLPSKKEEAWDCLQGYRQLCDDFKRAHMVVWLNQQFGDVTFEGKLFEETKVYAETRKRVTAIIRTPKLNGQRATTYGQDISEMWARLETFEEALAPDRQPPLAMMTRQRLTMFRRELWAQMDAAKVF